MTHFLRRVNNIKFNSNVEQFTLPQETAIVLDNLLSTANQDNWQQLMMVATV